jgi:hypothetical protein
VRRILATISVATLAGLSFSACSSGSSTPTTTGQSAYSFTATGPCQAYAKANPTAQVTTTPGYVIVANMGASESMYTPAQAASSHPMSGEIMVSGTMDNGMAMGSGTSTRHIEAHICSKSTGNVMTSIMPTMRLQGTGSGAMATSVPIAKMQGLDRNPADTHFGNNVNITPGSRYRLVMTVNGQTATLTLKAA